MATQAEYVREREQFPRWERGAGNDAAQIRRTNLPADGEFVFETFEECRASAVRQLRRMAENLRLTADEVAESPEEDYTNDPG